jgi:putative membrane protein
MTRTLVQVLLNAVALLVAAKLVPGISWQGGLLYLLLAGLVFGLINLVVKPLVTFFSLPLIVLTLGLFYLVVNALMLLLADFLLAGLRVAGFVPALLGGVVIALFNWMVRAFARG